MNSQLDIKRLAEVASLSLDDGECEKMAADLQELLAYADLLRSIENERSIEHATGASVLREDTVSVCLPREEILSAAPTQANGYLTVPLMMKDR